MSIIAIKKAGAKVIYNRRIEEVKVFRRVALSYTREDVGMFTYAKFVRVTVLTCLFFVPGQLAAQSATSRQSATDNEYQTGAVLWTQSSAEYRALALQSFTLARLRIDQDLAQHRSRRRMKPPAIIVDADETVLDNSRFQAELILRGSFYNIAGMATVG